MDSANLILLITNLIISSVILISIMLNKHVGKYTKITNLCLTLLLISLQIYGYVRFTTGSKEKTKSLRGLDFDPDDQKYNPIGGISGTGWL